ncbi:MAG: DUF362 domain-containing protein, partial [Thermoplasmata archaeon]|nr:DUF362 domain-containing protein [Thermoplasmata archaeon]
MKSKVFFARARVTAREKGLINRTGKLFDLAGGSQIIQKNDLVAIKLSFSHYGNTAYIRPQFFRAIVEKVKAAGGKPFLTDANTLYVGSRSNSVDHIETAIKNGFSYAVVGAPIIIADGLTGKNVVEIPINLKYCKTARIGGEVHFADGLVSVSHIHGHPGCGMAGTLKNVGMGLGCRAGKQHMHNQEEKPRVTKEKCIGCGECVTWCPEEAIQLIEEKAV